MGAGTEATDCVDGLAFFGEPWLSNFFSDFFFLNILLSLFIIAAFHSMVALLLVLVGRRGQKTINSVWYLLRAADNIPLEGSGKSYS